MAARELFISQPAVSVAIRQLEERYGKRLLIRSSKGIRPTVEGKALYDYLVQAMSLIQTAENKYFRLVGLEEGAITIGASDTILSNFLLPYIDRFLNKHPKVTIKITNNLTRDTIQLLKVGEIDLGFVNMPIVQDDQLELHECMSLNDRLFGGAKYRRLSETGLHIKKLNDYPLLMLEKTSSTRRFHDSFAESNGVILKPAIELSSTDLLLKFAKINLGLAFAAREFIPERAAGLYEIPLTPALPARSIGLVRLAGIPMSFAAAEFIELIKSRD